MSFIKNKLAQTISVAFLSALGFTNGHASEFRDKLENVESFKGFDIGYQFTVSSNGPSIQKELTEEITGQAILGAFGEFGSYVFRGKYHLATDQKWDAYAYGSLGLYTWDDDDTDEYVFAAGLGIGMEYDWQNFKASNPPITFSVELDANAAEFDNADFSKFALSFGAHYRF